MQEVSSTSIEGNVTSIHESMRANEIRENAPSDAFVFLLFEWRDDAKGNRGMRTSGSLWIKTISFVGSKCSNSQHLTYPLAIGPKNVDHEIVEKKFKEELNVLRSKNKKHIVFSSKVGKNIRVYGDVFASLMDQPERRSSNSLMLGNGLFSSRWGYSFNFKAVYQILPPCKVCFSNMKRSLILSEYSDLQKSLNGTCEKCVKWNIDSKHTLMKYAAPENFPIGVLETDENHNIKPFKLSYDILSRNISKVFHNITNGNWSMKQAKCLLNVLCISHVAQRDILSHAKNEFEFRQLSNNQFIYPRRYMNVLKEKNKYPKLFQEWNIPSLWTRDIPMNRTSDAIMHLIFLGIEKTVNRDITKFLLYNEKQSLYSREVDSLLTEILSLSISHWCDMLPYHDGHFSNWISDNHLGMSRLGSWFYTSLKKVMTNYKEPLEPVSKWTISDCKKWLKFRGLQSDEKSIKILRDEILYHKNKPVVRPILEKHDLEKQCNLILDMINAKTCMVYRLMSDVMNEEIIIEIEFYIKYFLSLYVKFDLLYDVEKKLPSWVTASNFICLLNLPELIREVGPLKNLWEGGDIGEKILGSVKDEFLGIRKNWTKALLERIISQRAIDKILPKIIEQQEDDSICSKYIRYGTYHKYHTNFEIRQLFNQNKVISIIQEIDLRFYVIMKDKTKMQIMVDYEKPSEEICGLVYFHWTYEYADTFNEQKLNVQNILRSCLLLPYQMNTEKLHAAISDDWKTMKENNVFGFPNMTIGDNVI